MLRVKFEGGISTIALLEKIREVINKRIQEKKKNEFTDLAPIDDIENGAEYLKALHWAIKKEKVKNIALAGPYGAGKSSIIDTYLKKHRITRRKALRVSMATFVENKTDKNGNPKKISLEQDEIELGILKQLFYKVNYKKIPQSRYRKLHKINWKRVWGYLVLIFFVFGIVEFIFFPDTFQMIIKKIEVAGGKFGLKGMVSNSIFLAFCVEILAIIARTYRLVLFRFKVNEVKLPAETVLKNSETAAETIFNKNMDEIVYFFEETKYRIVFFEDLDRLEDPSIFIHLRELNTLLNNYDGIKSITKEDMNYILAVKNMEKLPYNYNLTKVGMVIQRLQPYEFEQKSIFNFILLEYLLSEENENEKRMILIDQLSDRTVESWEFIDEFIEQTQYKERLIQLLAMRWPDMWNDIVQNISITYERKIFYLVLA